MKKILILFLVFLSSAAIAQTDNAKFPNYEGVVSQFFKNYSVKEVTSSSNITFEKRPQGWYIVVTDYSPSPKVVKNELLWSRDKKLFLNIGFKKAGSKNENDEKMAENLRKYDRMYYDISPYYGYAGWDWDVIQNLKKATNLNDTSLYVLGRAYSSYSSNLLNDNSGFADKTKQFKLSKGKNCLTENQLKEYRLYRHLAIEKFKQLSKQNPKFMTIVGPIWIKTSNEYLCSFLELRMYQNEQEANMELADNLYSDLYITYAKNYLNSCDTNAILFTNGDNDTYPLLYVQAKYGFRTDVLVVNMSLLQTERYINSFREQTLKAPALPLTLSPEDISGNRKDVIYIQKEEENEQPIEISSLVQLVKDEQYTMPDGGSKIVYVPSNKLIFSKGKQSIQWEINNQYFLLNHLILLDVIATGKLERPIYFANAVDPDYFFGLNDYMQLEGLAYRLTTNKTEKPDQTGSVNTGALYDNLMNKFDWSGMKMVDNTDKSICPQYRTIFHRLADALIEENKKDSARKVLDLCLRLMPNEQCYFDEYFIPIIDDYYRISEFEKGNQIARILIHNLKNNLDIYSSDDPTARKEWDKHVIDYLKILFEKYNQEVMLKELD